MRNTKSKLIPPLGERDHVLGPPSATVTLVEYGDFECPHCGAAYPIVQEILDRLGDRLQFAYRHFPLAQIHPHAEDAAEAAEAAGAQGRFWKMHDLLFRNQQTLEDRQLIHFAGRLGLDVARFRSELLEHVHHQRVREDFKSGVKSGVNGTPTFFINGVRYDGAWQMLLEELAERVTVAD